MSIYVVISRRSDPLDEVGPSIAAEDWLQTAHAQKDFRSPTADEKRWLQAHALMWIGYEYPVAFDYVDGEVWVKNPDATIVSRMKTLARALSADVFSETGELFMENGEHAGFLPGFP